MRIFIARKSIAVLLCNVWCCSSTDYTAIAAITAVGDLSAAYDGIEDPWSIEDKLLVGITTNGSLTIDGGSTVNNTHASLGENSSGAGSVLVTGPGSHWNNSSYVHVGHRGSGALAIEAGGKVTATSLRIGDFSQSIGTVNVSGPGSRLEGSVSAGFWTSGTLNITDGAVVSGYGGDIANRVNSTGTATVSGTGSVWEILSLDDEHFASEFYVGFNGNANLNVLNGGTVNVNGDTAVGYTNSGVGLIHFNNGSLHTEGLRAATTDLRGTGIINARGLVSDVDLNFDATHGLQQQFHLQDLPGQNIVLNLDMTPMGRKLDLGVGKRGSASLRIADGVIMDTYSGRLGDHSGSSGTAILSGAGTKWLNEFGMFVGNYGNGSLRVETGAEVHSDVGFIGSHESSSGTVVVTGNNSSWVNRRPLSVGVGGNGRLDILDGAFVDVEESTWIGERAEGDGIIHFDQGTLTTKTLLAAPYQLTGTGTINTRGLVSDVDLVFDSTNLNPQIVLDSLPGQNITINVIREGATSGTEYFGAGYRGEGSLTIADGRTIRSSNNYLGYHEGSSGHAMVTGEGSTWQTNLLNVGNSGAGSMLIEDGGKVASENGFVSRADGSNDRVTVTGVGSTWETTSALNLGKYPLLLIGQEYSTQAELHITHGGLVRVGSEGSNVSLLGNGLYLEEDSFVNLETGGMLALFGRADSSVTEFMSLVGGDGTINYWDGVDWSPIHNAVFGDDYTLEYHDAGDSLGFTVLTVGSLPRIEGDYDGDDDVDGADFLKWQRALGGTATLTDWDLKFGLPLAVDFNGDGEIGIDDLDDSELGWRRRYANDLHGSHFILWQQNRSSTSNAPTALQAVPEPSTLMLAVGVCVTLATRPKVASEIGVCIQ